MALLPHVALSGMMGTGKSTVATLVATRQGWPLVDLDARIEARAGSDIPTIFAEKGEAVFRRLEHEALASALDASPSIIAFGGGTVTNLRNRELLQGRCRVITLTASPATLLKRIGDVSSRPLLARHDTEAARLKVLREMIVMRARAYSEADLLLDTEGSDPARVAEQVMGQMWAWGIPPGVEAAGR
ncbi:MAG: shikimate kinase [Bradymonadia bacterium]